MLLWGKYIKMITLHIQRYRQTELRYFTIYQLENYICWLDYWEIETLLEICFCFYHLYVYISNVSETSMIPVIPSQLSNSNTIALSWSIAILMLNIISKIKAQNNKDAWNFLNAIPLFWDALSACENWLKKRCKLGISMFTQPNAKNKAWWCAFFFLLFCHPRVVLNTILWYSSTFPHAV